MPSHHHATMSTCQRSVLKKLQRYERVPNNKAAQLLHPSANALQPSSSSRTLSSTIQHTSGFMSNAARSSPYLIHNMNSSNSHHQFISASTFSTSASTTTNTSTNTSTNSGGTDSPSSLSPGQTISQRIQSLVAEGELRPDPAQIRVAKRLSRLQQALRGYDNAALVEYTSTVHLLQQLQQRDVTQQSDVEQKHPRLIKDQPDDGQHNYLDEDAILQRMSSEAAATTVDDESSPPSSSTPISVSTPVSEVSSPQAFALPPPPSIQVPRGLYIYGDVGTGKSMLMDLFYATLISNTNANTITHTNNEQTSSSISPLQRIQRVHFHAFLADIHHRIHHLKQQDLQTHGRSFKVDTRQEHNPIYRVGLEVASELSVLCLDEFQVTDIADALILSQFFSVLFRHGVVVVATSNRPPEDLYEGGLNRSYFLPFIDLLQRHCIAHSMNSDVDYRTMDVTSSSLTTASSVSASASSTPSSTAGRVFFGSAADVNATLDSLLAASSQKQQQQQQQQHENADSSRTAHRTSSSIQLNVGHQRTLEVGQVHESLDMGVFTFEELCNQDLGAMDYRAIATTFGCVQLTEVPILTLEEHNQARRFITLIDELYEGRCALLCSTRDGITDPKRLFQASSILSGDNEMGEEDVIGIDVATHKGGAPVGALASVRELEFAFQRAASRIYEMCSSAWWMKHVGGDRFVD